MLQWSEFEKKRLELRTMPIVSEGTEETHETHKAFAFEIVTWNFSDTKY